MHIYFEVSLLKPVSQILNGARFFDLCFQSSKWRFFLEPSSEFIRLPRRLLLGWAGIVLLFSSVEVPIILQITIA